MSGAPAERRPRSLADELRARDDDALVALLRDRPDLRTPVPADVAALAARATTRPSVQRALDRLDLFTLQVLDSLLALPDGARLDDVARLTGPDIDISRPMALLRGQALVYGAEDDLAVVRTVREVVGDPAGLGPPAGQVLPGYGPSRLAGLLDDLGLRPSGDPVTDAQQVTWLLSDRAAVDRLLAGAPPAAAELLATLTWGPPAGTLERADRPVRRSTAATPVEWLLSRALLVVTGRSTVVLPREVGLHLRDGRVHAAVATSAPEPVLRPADAVRTDQAAAGAAATAVRLVEDLLEMWAADPPKALRTGGLAVRDRARTAAALELDQDQLNLVVETAHAAGLLAAGGEVDEVWLPSTTYDAWRAESVAARWGTLAAAWLTTMRVAGLSGSKDSRGRVLAPLGPDLVRSLAPGVRRDVLEELAAVHEGSATTAESVAERLRWRAPRLFGPLRESLVGWTMREAEMLGLAAGGALGRPGRLLAGGSVEGAVGDAVGGAVGGAVEAVGGAVAALDGLLPEPLDHIVLQADLTAVAPGPLTGELTQTLAAIADVESRGGATVYRFSDATVRRALDLGWTAADVLGALRAHSRTPVPQPLSYLVEDVARRHGRVRVGVASAYLRCDDESTLTEILADRRVSALRLRRLAPTVVAAQAPVDAVLATLRAMGHAPAAEGADGTVVLRRPDDRRAPAPRRLPPVAPPAELPPAVLGAAVHAIRAGDRARTALKRPAGGGAGVGQGAGPRPGAGAPPSAATVDVLALLQQAAVAGETVWIGYVDAHGQATQRLIEPRVVEGGFVEAFDHLRQDVRRFAVHRMTGAAVVDQADAAGAAELATGP